MGYMTSNEPYDWADDDNLDLAQTLERLQALTPAIVVVESPSLTMASAPSTHTTSSSVITKSFYSPRRQAVIA